MKCSIKPIDNNTRTETFINDEVMVFFGEASCISPDTLLLSQ